MINAHVPGAFYLTIFMFLAVTVFLMLCLLRLYSQGRRREAMNEYLVNVIDSANEGMYVTDRERRFLLWNEAAERISGYREEDLIGRFCHDNILCHVDREGSEICLTRCPLNIAVETGIAHGPEIIYLRHRSGRRVPVEVKTAPLCGPGGDIIGGVEIFQDVSVRLERERLLRERTEKLETVLDSINDGILFLDSGGHITVFNHACAEMFGLSKGIVGSAIYSHPGHMPLRLALAAAEREFSLLSARSGKGQDEIGCATKDDSFRCWTSGVDCRTFAQRSACYTCTVYRVARHFLETSREFVWGERTISAVSSFIELGESNELWEVIIFRDVTAEKLDAALKVAGAAAHELRQPLQVIVLLAGMLKLELHDSGSFDYYLDTLAASCRRMDRIIHQMGELTSYRTKEYVDGTKILDIEGSCGNRKTV